MEHNQTDSSSKMTQLELMQKFEDEFEVQAGQQSMTLIVPGSIFMKCDLKSKLTSEHQTKYCSGIGKTLHLMR